MSLVDELRALLGRDDARSFQLLGDDLTLLSGARLGAAAAAYASELERVPAPLRARFETEQAALLADAHAWLRRHNRSLLTRVRGYLALGEACGFAYPWPVVAILGICQVQQGLARTHLYGLLGPLARRVGFRLLEEIAEGSDDLLRRTNRAIFADSVPTVLLGLRCRELRRRGDGALADALLAGPPAPVMDAESIAIAAELDAGLAEPDAGARWRRLAALTARHFDREQAIFTYHLGGDLRERAARPPRREPALTRRFTRLRAVPAPVVAATRRGRRVEFRPFALPDDFDIRDHAARVEAFQRAFVESVTGDPADYAAAQAFVKARFGQ